MPPPRSAGRPFFLELRGVALTAADLERPAAERDALKNNIVSALAETFRSTGHWFLARNITTQEAGDGRHVNVRYLLPASHVHAPAIVNMQREDDTLIRGRPYRVYPVVVDTNSAIGAARRGDKKRARRSNDVDVSGAKTRTQQITQAVRKEGTRKHRPPGAAPPVPELEAAPRSPRRSPPKKQVVHPGDCPACKTWEMRYSKSKRAIFFVSTTAGVSLWQYGSSPGTGFQQPVGCSCGCPRRLLSAADYRGCSAPETATVTAPAANTPTVSLRTGMQSGRA